MHLGKRPEAPYLAVAGQAVAAKSNSAHPPNVTFRTVRRNGGTSFLPPTIVEPPQVIFVLVHGGSLHHQSILLRVPQEDRAPRDAQFLLHLLDETLVHLSQFVS